MPKHKTLLKIAIKSLHVVYWNKGNKRESMKMGFECGEMGRSYKNRGKWMIKLIERFHFAKISQFSLIIHLGARNSLGFDNKEVACHGIL